MEKRLEDDRFDDPPDRLSSPLDMGALPLSERVLLSMTCAPAMAPFEIAVSDGAPEIGALAPVWAMRPGA